MVHWTKKPENKAKLARAAAKRSRTRKKRGRGAKSGDAVRYGRGSGVIGTIRAELRDAQKRVVALKAILKRYSRI